ncbi:hypothetical protein L249_0316 [Ophiocordyceps polyrhachis-furcata BCC 54312]|uniref:Uncharacterized protein n=1 Tax=Ophiocordyceps polyrhachis-furcata BCC 54312 TaxID=1330021 RepID=A0A367LDY3_9HYPO|nr:hypothetical protein L249_0316 [Ophiocordyceps polyrhachis-furcata BCC 54312]
MVGTASYKDQEIAWVLQQVIDKTVGHVVMQGFEHLFGRPLSMQQIRYLRNKYGRDPRFNCSKANINIRRFQITGEPRVVSLRLYIPALCPSLSLFPFPLFIILDRYLFPLHLLTILHLLLFHLFTILDRYLFLLHLLPILDRYLFPLHPFTILDPYLFLLLHLLPIPDRYLFPLHPLTIPYPYLFLFPLFTIPCHVLFPSHHR